MSLDWVAFDSSKFFISLMILFKVNFLDENGKATSYRLWFISSILGCFSKYFIAFNTRSLGRVIFGRDWMIKFDTLFEKCSLKIFTSSLSSDSTSSFSVSVILSSFNVLSVMYGLAIFQNCLFSVTRLTSRLLKRSFLGFFVVA